MFWNSDENSGWKVRRMKTPDEKSGWKIRRMITPDENSGWKVRRMKTPGIENSLVTAWHENDDRWIFPGNWIIQKQKINRSKVLSKNIIVAWCREFGPEYSTEIDGRESPDPNGAIYCGIRRVSAKFSFTYVIAIFNPFPNRNECYNGDCMVYYSPFGAKVWW